jgi:hypothetical protein
MERSDRMGWHRGNTLNPNLKGGRFESRQVHRLSFTEIFPHFLQAADGIVRSLGHNHFFPDPSQLILPLECIYSRCWHCRKMTYRKDYGSGRGLIKVLSRHLSRCTEENQEPNRYANEFYIPYISNDILLSHFFRNSCFIRSKSEFLHDWRFTANQFVLATSPLRLTTQQFYFPTEHLLS